MASCQAWALAEPPCCPTAAGLLAPLPTTPETQEVWEGSLALVSCRPGEETTASPSCPLELLSSPSLPSDSLQENRFGVACVRGTWHLGPPQMPPQHICLSALCPNEQVRRTWQGEGAVTAEGRRFPQARGQGPLGRTLSRQEDWAKGAQQGKTVGRISTWPDGAELTWDAPHLEPCSGGLLKGVCRAISRAP